jgi:hypothetical protein
MIHEWVIPPLHRLMSLRSERGSRWVILLYNSWAFWRSRDCKQLSPQPLNPPEIMQAMDSLYGEILAAPFIGFVLGTVCVPMLIFQRLYSVYLFIRLLGATILQAHKYFLEYRKDAWHVKAQVRSSTPSCVLKD